MTLAEFIEKYNGKFIDLDGAFGPQCMDEMHQALLDLYGLAKNVLAAPSASDVFNKFETLTGHENFTKTANTPEGVPQEGDVVVFGSTVGPNGHVATFIKGDTKAFTSFDQNWPVGLPCHIQAHDYKGCLGWLHFIGTTKTYTQAEYDAAMADRKKFWEERDATLAQLVEVQKNLMEVNSNYTAIAALGVNTVDDLQKERTSYAAIVEGYTREISQVRDRNADLALQISKMEKEESTTLDQAIVAIRERDQLAGEIAEVKKTMGASAKLDFTHFIEHLQSIITVVEDYFAKQKKPGFQPGTLAPAIDTKKEAFWDDLLKITGFAVFFLAMLAGSIWMFSR